MLGACMSRREIGAGVCQGLNLLGFYALVAHPTATTINITPCSQVLQHLCDPICTFIKKRVTGGDLVCPPSS